MKKLIYLIIISFLCFNTIACNSQETCNAKYFKNNPMGFQLAKSDKYDAYAINEIFDDKGFEPKMEIMVDTSNDKTIIQELYYSSIQSNEQIPLVQMRLDFFGLDFFLKYVSEIYSYFDKNENIICTKNGEVYTPDTEHYYYGRIEECYNPNYPELSFLIDYQFKNGQEEVITERCNIHASYPYKYEDLIDKETALEAARNYMQAIGENLVINLDTDYEYVVTYIDGKIDMRLSANTNLRNLYFLVYHSDFFDQNSKIIQ